MYRIDVQTPRHLIWNAIGMGAKPNGISDGGKIAQLAGVPCAFTPDYAPEEMFEIANKLYQKAR